MTGRSRPAVVFAAAVLLVAGAGTGCGKRRQVDSLASLSAAKSYERAVQQIQQRDLRQARETLEQIQYSIEERERYEPLSRIAMADATFYQGTDLGYIDARGLYLDFVTLYGDNALAPYAQLQAGLCSLKQVSHPSKDQTQTLQAIEDLTHVLRRYPDSPYGVAARDLLAQARANLAEHEYLVGRFYLKRNNYKAAVERFRLVVDAYPEMSDKEKVLFHLGRALQLGGNPEESRIYLGRLVSDYPESGWAGAARRELSSMSTGIVASADGSPD